MKFIPANDELAKIAEDAPEQILKGLPIKAMGLIIARPDIGKSYLAQSIAYSASTGYDFLGLLVRTNPIKVAYWGIEEGIHEVAKKATGQMSNFSHETKKLLSDNLFFVHSDDAICYGSSSSKSEQNKANENLDSLIDLIIESKCEILIIDTLREAIATAKETDDDSTIRSQLSKITNRTNCSVIIVHHVTKDFANKKGFIDSSVAQSGLSTTGSKCRVHYSLNLDEKNQLSLYFPKGNLLSPSEKTPKNLHWTDFGQNVSILYTNKEEVNRLSSSGPNADSKNKPKLKKEKAPALSGQKSNLKMTTSESNRDKAVISIQKAPRPDNKKRLNSLREKGVRSSSIPVKKSDQN